MEPVRTCVGCRGRENKSDLIRLVRSGEAIVVDVRQSRPGRGVYLHPRPQCWEQAFRRRALARGLQAGNVDQDRLRTELAELIIDPS
ncbi:YlxR family protein [Microlunatus elymi]|uniref:YlxR family protein n=1 Tax=Microlunatus elymi TaxID=2596828 RepID=UPI001AEFB130|nr:YlxR family protein [Microlunatus elymi]